MRLYGYIRNFITKSQFITGIFDFLAIVGCLTGNKKILAAQNLLLAQHTILVPEVDGS